MEEPKQEFAAALDQHLGVGVGWVEDDEAEAGAAPVAGG